MPVRSDHRQAPHVGALAGADEEGADDGRSDTERGDEQREYGQLISAGGQCAGAHRGQGDRRDDRADVGLEEVGAHAGNVAHVVTYIIGDGGRVTGIVFRYPLLYLAHEVGADVGGFRVDTTTDSGKERD